LQLVLHRRPVGVFAPAIAATFESSGVLQTESSFIFEVVSEKRRLVALAKLVGCRFAKLNGAEMTRRAAPLAVVPGADDEEVLMMGIVRLKLRIGFLRAEHVFLIPKATDEECGDGNLIEMPLHGAAAPELVICRMFEKRDSRGEFVHAIVFCGSSKDPERRKKS
jgi:hypothetical protein